MLDPKLYSLLAVEATGNFTRAAEQLSLTQPAVSQHVRALEQELGVRIFERVNNAVKLTHEGEIVVKYAKRMMALQEGRADEREIADRLSDRRHHPYRRKQRDSRSACALCPAPRKCDRQGNHRRSGQALRHAEKL